MFFNKTMTQNSTPGYLRAIVKGLCDGVLHPIIWAPKSPDLNPLEMVWVELDHRVKEEKTKNAQHVGIPSRVLESHSRL